MADSIQYFELVGPLHLVGVLGFIVYLLAFGGVQFGRLDGNGAAYSLFNVAAACLVAVSLIAEFNLASALIQGSWIAIGLAGLSKRLMSKRYQRPQALVFPNAQEKS